MAVRTAHGIGDPGDPDGACGRDAGGAVLPHPPEVLLADPAVEGLGGGGGDHADQLDPAGARAIVAKSMFHHVAGFGEVAGQFVWVNTPGPVHADVCALPYTKISRPVFPLDDVTDWR